MNIDWATTVVVDWSTVGPILVSQLMWVTIVLLVNTQIVKYLLRKEGDRLAASLTPLLKRVEHLGFMSSEQASMNASALQKVMSKQGDAATQVEQVPTLTADKVVEKLPQQAAE